MSVIIPFYQKESGILRKALQSVQRQIIPQGWEIEAIVIDDGSPVAALSEVVQLETLPNVAIKVVAQENGGVAAARNRGLSEIGPDTNLVAFLDSDDMWPDSHVSQAIAAMNEGYDIFFCDNGRAGFHDSHLKSSAPETLAKLRNGDGKFYELTGDEFAMLTLTEFPAQLSTLVYRHELGAGQFFNSDLKYASEDVLFLVTLGAKAGKVACLPDVQVECGRGINMYFGNFSWDCPKFMPIQFDKLAAHYFVSQIRDLPNCTKQENQKILKSNMASTIYHIARYVIKNGGRLPPNIGWFGKIFLPALGVAFGFPVRKWRGDEIHS